MGVPITVEGELWGLIAVVSTGEEPPPPGTQERLAGFTELVATAIANAQARQELRTIADEQAALGRVATLVAQGEAPAVVFAAVAEEVGHLLNTDDALVVRFEPDESVTIVASWTGTGEPLPVGDRRHVEPGDGLTPLVRKTGLPARIDSQTAYYSELGVESAVAAPITVEGRIWGVVGVASRGSVPAPPDTEERLAAFTGLVATAIANAESREELMASRERIVAAADRARGVSSVTCTTAPSSSWRHSCFGCARPRRPCRPNWQLELDHLRRRERRARGATRARAWNPPGDPRQGRAGAGTQAARPPLRRPGRSCRAHGRPAA